MLPLLLLPGASESVRDLFFFFTLCSAESFVRGGSQHGTAPASNAKHPWHFGLEPKKKRKKKKKKEEEEEEEEETHATFFLICFDGLSVFTLRSHLPLACSLVFIYLPV